MPAKPSKKIKKIKPVTKPVTSLRKSVKRKPKKVAAKKITQRKPKLQPNRELQNTLQNTIDQFSTTQYFPIAPTPPEPVFKEPPSKKEPFLPVQTKVGLAVVGTMILIFIIWTYTLPFTLARAGGEQPVESTTNNPLLNIVDSLQQTMNTTNTQLQHWPASAPAQTQGSGGQALSDTNTNTTTTNTNSTLNNLLSDIN